MRYQSGVHKTSSLDQKVDFLQNLDVKFQSRLKSITAVQYYEPTQISDIKEKEGLPKSNIIIMMLK